MKKWFLLATAILTFSGVSGAALYQHQANAGTDTKTVTVTTPKKQPAATVKPKKERDRLFDSRCNKFLSGNNTTF